MPTIVSLPDGWEADRERLVQGLIVLGFQAEQELRFDEALEKYTQALVLAPELPEPRVCTGSVLLKKKQYDEAERYTRGALGIGGLNAGSESTAWNTLACISYERRDLERALELLEKSLAVDPLYRVALVNKGAVLVLLRRLEEAYACFDEAALLGPDDFVPRVNKGLLRVMRGDWLRGFPGYEHRAIAEEKAANFPVPRWQGEDVRGKRLCVWQDQGAGDVVWAWRLVRELIGRGTDLVYANVYEPIRGILPQFPGLSWVFPGDQLNLNFHVPIMSLPYALRLRSDQAPPPCGIVVAEAKRAKWAAFMPAGRPFRVGLCWSGNINHKLDNLRSIPLRIFRGLFSQFPQAEWWCLQKEVRHADRGDLEGISINLPDISDFGDVAAMIEHMDLVISVDTSILHIAAEMGRETWGLMPHAPDFRWGMDAERIGWYPALKMYRNAAPVGGWEEVIERVAADLRGRLS